MVGREPTPVAWGEDHPRSSRVLQTHLNPSRGALFVFLASRHILSHVTFHAAVPDSQVYSCNLEVVQFHDLPTSRRYHGKPPRSRVTDLAKVAIARTYAWPSVRKAGVDSTRVRGSVGRVAGSRWLYQRSGWDSFKDRSWAGSWTAFAQLGRSRRPMGGYYVPRRQGNADGCCRCGPISLARRDLASNCELTDIAMCERGKPQRCAMNFLPQA